jgi:hypothetical protein
MVRESIDYRETVELLQYKLINYIRLNDRLNKNIRYKTRFVVNTDTAIHFNFIEFSEAYRVKYVDKDFEKYCVTFIDFLKPLLRGFLQEVNYGAHTFQVIIKYGAKKYDKIFTVLNKD